MNTLKQLYVIAVVSASAIVASIGTPSWATSDKSTKLAAPYWLDETIYRPDCSSNDRDRRSYPGVICDDKGGPQWWGVKRPAQR